MPWEKFLSTQELWIQILLPPKCRCMATYFIDKTTGSSLYFHKGGNQDGKLWSMVRFKDLDELTSMLEQPDVQIITDLNIPERMKKQLDKNDKNEL